MNIGYHLTQAGLWYPDRIALIHGQTRLTFRETLALANRMANALLGLGLKKGERVALLSPNRHQLTIAEYGVLKAGLVVVPLNARLSTGELVHMLNNSEAAALILGREFVEAIEASRHEIETVRHFVAMSDTPPSMLDFDTLLDQASPEEPDVQVEMDDLARLNYTSGTTGKLKAAMLTHRNRLCLARKHLFVEGMDLTRDSVMCHVAPVTHASGGMILPIWWRGGRNLLLPGFELELLCRTIENEKVTHLFLVPTMINYLMAYPERERYDLSSIRTIVYGASPMPSQRIRQALEIFGPVLIQGYGQTETSSGFIYLTKEDHRFDGDPEKEKRLKSAGRPLPEVEVRVVDEDGRDVEPGQVGEIIERGDDSMLGYWKDPEMTRETVRDGWIYTRDMAMVDESGYIYIVDRKSDMIISGGFNIYPSEVEQVLYQHPAVFEAAVVAVPDEEWGESVKAVVVLRPGHNVGEEQIVQFCKDRLASFKKPRSVDFVDELPKNPYGKVLRRKIKEKYWDARDRMVH
ncbi:MAG: long-chain fatty acid--CoA ligase [Proteobacteria bacterium]|nr:long-chain fatty acid--CoA ligase [Pseudomonadota bacterium]